MLHEFAVEPALLGEWHEFRYLREKFGVPQARMIAEFPKKWRRMVYDAASGFTEKQRKMLEEWMADKASFLVPGERAYTLPDDWLKSAEVAHTEKPFHAVLARENPRKHTDVVSAEQPITEKHSLFHCLRERKMPKTVAGFLTVARPLLQWSRQIIFVDPYFQAIEKYGTPLKAMLACLQQNVTPLRYCTSASPNGEELSFRCTQLLKNISQFIPQKIELEIVLLAKNPGGDTHNRFILTDRGGLKFPWGLDTSKNSQEDTVNLMEKEPYQAKFAEFLHLSSHSVVDRLTITGTARL